MKCESCGKEVSDNSNFCSACGEPVGSLDRWEKSLNEIVDENDDDDSDSSVKILKSKYCRGTFNKNLCAGFIHAQGSITDTSMTAFKKCLKLPKKLDNMQAYVLSRFIISQKCEDLSSGDFNLPWPVAENCLRELMSLGYLTRDDDIKDTDQTVFYYLSDAAYSELIQKGTLSLSNLSSNTVCNTKKIKSKYIIDSSKIKLTELFYNKELVQSLESVKNTLRPDNFSKVQSRLLEENQHSGVCISFYGPSGTGKTEKVMQLAKEINRDVYDFKIADTESQFCGFQEAAINKMFSDFKEISERYKKMGKPEPILLLNEADALFSKRHAETEENNTPNRENNTTQAELLDHLDNFDGILIITTNFIQNFDDAMERRLLFKIKFDLPDKPTQKLIWKSRFNNLSEDDICLITNKYNFTGGNIQNIRKKTHMNYIISGQEPTVDYILTLCKDEKINVDKSRKIGFDL